MLNTAKSANVQFRLVVQLVQPPTNPANAPATKIPFINSEKNYCGYQQCEHKY